MIRALLTGTLHADPDSRTSKTGRPYCTARLRADTGDGNTTWCGLIAFAEQAERLAMLKAGAAISVSGRVKVTAWVGKSGEPAAGLDLVVDELITLRGKPRPRDAAPPDRRPPVAAGFDDMDRWQA